MKHLLSIFILITLFPSDIVAQSKWPSYSKETNGVELHNSVITEIRVKCVRSYLSYKQYYNINSYPYKKLIRRYIEFENIIPDTLEKLDSFSIKTTSKKGFWIWPYLSAYKMKSAKSKIFKNYSTFYVYDSTYQFYGVVAVNDTDHTNIKLLGGQFAHIDLMFDELAVQGIDSMDHLIGRPDPYSRKYKAGRNKIHLSNVTTSLEFYAKILSRTFDASFFGYAIYKPRPRMSAILSNYWVNYHRGKTNYRYYKNGEYEIVVSTDIFVLYPSNAKTKNLEDTDFKCIYVSTDYPYASFEGCIPAEIKFRINPTENTIKVKITKIEDINAIPECLLKHISDE